MNGSRASAMVATMATIAQAWAVDEQPVTRAEFERLRADNDHLQLAIDQLRKNAAAGSGTEVVSREEFLVVKDAVDAERTGATKFLLTGYASGTFASRPEESPAFATAFNPILLWRMDDRLSFAGELEFERADNATTINLEYAHINYHLGDLVTLSAHRGNPGAHLSHLARDRS